MSAPQIAFVDFSRNFYDRHHVYCLAATLAKAGIAVRYVPARRYEDAFTALSRLGPDLLCYSAISAEIDLYAGFDRFVKERSTIRSIIGGPGATYDWGICQRTTIDAQCVGEGERALEEFVHGGFDGGGNVIVGDAEAPEDLHPLLDLDSLPLPERELVYSRDALLRNNGSKQFLSGRGCPYTCTYCFNNRFNKVFADRGKIVRKKSVTCLVDEILQVQQKYGLKNVVFQDDTFIANRAWFEAFCELYPVKVGLPYTCNIRANLVTREVVELLKQSGCRAVNWSIETGNDRLRNEVLKRGMLESQILETGALLREARIPNRIGNMLGLPGETFENMLETVQLNVRAKPGLALANIFVPYTSLDLTEYALREGYLSEEAAERLPKDYFTTSVLNYSDRDRMRIRKLMCLFPVLVKHPFLLRSPFFRLLMALPCLLLRGLYECVYVYGMARLYGVSLSLKGTAAMLVRYMQDLAPRKPA